MFWTRQDRSLSSTCIGPQRYSQLDAIFKVKADRLVFIYCGTIHDLLNERTQFVSVSLCSKRRSLIALDYFRPNETS